MDAGINNVIYMELYSGPKMANGRCGKTIDTGTIDRGSTVLERKKIGATQIVLIRMENYMLKWFVHVQCVPLATEPGISFIILTTMKILQ